MRRSQPIVGASPRKDMVVVMQGDKFYEIPRADYANRVEIFKNAQKSQPSIRERSKERPVSSGVTTPNTRRRHDAAESRYPSLAAAWRQNNLDNGMQYFNDLEQEFKKSMSKPMTTTSGIRQETSGQGEKVSPATGSYALDNIVESQETVDDHQASSEGKPVESRETLADFTLNPVHSTTASTETIGSKSMPIVMDSLFQLKRTVTNLIDKTIKEIESQEDLTAGKVNMLQPSGDGHGMEHRVQNLKVLGTESFMQNKKNTRKKLYAEIEAILKRLKEYELHE